MCDEARADHADRRTGADRRAGAERRTGSDRRHEAERRMLSSSSPDLQLAELEMRIAAVIRQSAGSIQGNGSGWDKLIVTLP
jgi:hypothetical protein